MQQMGNIQIYVCQWSKDEYLSNPPTLIYNFPYYISLRDVHTTWHIHFEKKIVLNHYITIYLSIYLFNKYLLSKYHVKRDCIQHTKISESLYFASNLGTTHNTFFVATRLFYLSWKFQMSEANFSANYKTVSDECSSILSWIHTINLISLLC